MTCRNQWRINCYITKKEETKHAFQNLRDSRNYNKVEYLNAILFGLRILYSLLNMANDVKVEAHPSPHITLNSPYQIYVLEIIECVCRYVVLYI